jgi:hypothetical protein
VGTLPDQPVPVERPGGVRIQDRSEPSRRDLVVVEGLGGVQIWLHTLPQPTGSGSWRLPELMDSATQPGTIMIGTM